MGMRHFKIKLLLLFLFYASKSVMIRPIYEFHSDPAMCHCGKYELQKMELREFYTFAQQLDGGETSFSGEKNDGAGKYQNLRFASWDEIVGNEESKWAHLWVKAYVHTLSDQDDNQVFHATMIGREARNCVAIKVVRMENLRETKPKWLVTHELQMLELAKRDGRQSVVHLIEGEAVENAAFFMLELGETDLGRYLLELQGKWVNNPSQIWTDLRQIVAATSTTLADFHKFAIHNGLKPGNWLLTAREPMLTLKLIDLQMTAPVDKEGVIRDVEYKRVICKVYPRNHFPRTRRFASPELGAFCGSIQQRHHFKSQQQIRVKSKSSRSSSRGKTMLSSCLPWGCFGGDGYMKLKGNSAQQQEPKLAEDVDAAKKSAKNRLLWRRYSHAVMSSSNRPTTKSDIWSLGALICQILSMTPQFMAETKEWRRKSRDREAKDFELILNAFVLELPANGPEHQLELEDVELESAKQQRQGIVQMVKREFPLLIPALEAIFSIRPEGRPSAKLLAIFFTQIEHVNHLVPAEQTKAIELWVRLRLEEKVKEQHVTSTYETIKRIFSREISP